ncbi:MAG: hypothetical protein V3T58_07540 [Candidatus Hydrothermarchaeales archaeon]
MTGKQTPIGFLDFKDTLKDEKRFYLEGWERIQKYYQIEDEELRYKETELKKAPHDHIKDTAKSFIGLAISESQDLKKMTDASDVLLGVGVELFLKSMLLKEDPERFINGVKIRDDYVYTPSLKQCTGIVMDLLGNELDKDQLERLEDILTLINTRRNELIHLHFHQVGHYAIPYQILNILEFLFGKYFREEEEFVERLSELKEKHRVVGSGMDFRPVEFPKLEEG